MKTNFRKPVLNLKVSVVDVKLMKTKGKTTTKEMQAILFVIYI